MAARPTASLALHRFGLGSDPGEADTIDDPVAWLTAQVQQAPARTSAERDRPDARTRLGELLSLAETLSGQAQRRARVQQMLDWARADEAAWWHGLLTSPAPFFHRWWSFWANHFTTSRVKREVSAWWGPHRNEALRPRVLGSFRELLGAAILHPAMLVYLDNDGSIGPNSRAGSMRGRGLNENLARELLELHTLGVGGGYDQDDVTELARLLTGWTVPRRVPRAHEALVAFRARRHEPGSKTILGRRFAEGPEAADAVLDRLAAHPSTRRFLCRKLAAHFVADDPPDVLVAGLEHAWERSGGDLAEVARALVSHPAAWEASPGKVKGVEATIIGSLRAVRTDPEDARHAGLPPARYARMLGQPTGRPPSPAGWEDTPDALLAPEPLLSRIDVAIRVANRRAHEHADIVALGERVLGERFRHTDKVAIREAGRRQGLVLLLTSPSFLRS